MQVGDLVQLSAGGRKSQQNNAVDECWGGMIVEINPSNHCVYPFKVEWYGKIKGDRALSSEGGSILPMKRYEIKKLKVKK